MTQNRLCIKRGNKENLSALQPGEPAYSTDIRHLHIGGEAGEITHYINSDQIESRISIAKKELSDGLSFTETDIDKIITCNNSADYMHFEQKQLIQEGFTGFLVGSIPARTSTGVILNAKTNYTVNFDVVIPDEVQMYYLCGCRNLTSGWYLAVQERKFVFFNAASNSNFYSLENIVPNQEKFNLSLLITNGIGIKLYINNTLALEIESTSLSNTELGINATSALWQGSYVPEVSNYFMYSRRLSFDEIQYNLQVIRSPYLIDKINNASPVFKSHNVFSEDGFNLEQTYTHLLKSSSFDFSDVNGKVKIHKAIKNSKIISAKILGKTINGNKVNIIMNVNGENYPFYENAIDKSNKITIKLGTEDELEILENGTGLLKKGLVITTIPKEIMPAIALQEDNLIYLNSDVSPTAINIAASINQNAHIEELINLLEIKTYDIAGLCTEV